MSAGVGRLLMIPMLSWSVAACSFAPTTTPSLCPTPPHTPTIRQMTVTPAQIEFPAGSPPAGQGFYVPAQIMSDLLIYINDLETKAGCE